eukprot:Skav230196  [mRNA]  locus=scaffold1418:320991:323135:+ [translate_table: standard]
MALVPHLYQHFAFAACSTVAECCVPSHASAMCKDGWQQPLSIEEVREAADKDEAWALKALEQLLKLERCAHNKERLYLSSCAWLHRIASQQGRHRYATRQNLGCVMFCVGFLPAVVESGGLF